MKQNTAEIRAKQKDAAQKGIMVAVTIISIYVYACAFLWIAFGRWIIKDGFEMYGDTVCEQRMNFSGPAMG